MSNELRIAPSILSADFSRLGEHVNEVVEAGAHQLHVDVMDGHFVPNLTMGPLVVSALRKVTEIPLDVHLMITDPKDYLGPFVDAGAHHITFHVEANSDVDDCIAYLRDQKVGVGLAVSPDTPVERVLDWVPAVDMVLIMTVHPGFAGQSLIESALDKIPALRAREKEIRGEGGEGASFDLDVQVDGGIDLESIGLARTAGANVFVAGSSIFGEPDAGRAVQAFAERLREFSAATP